MKNYKGGETIGVMLLESQTYTVARLILRIFEEKTFPLIRDMKWPKNIL